MNIIIMGDRQPYLAIVLVRVMRGCVIWFKHIINRISMGKHSIFFHDPSEMGWGCLLTKENYLFRPFFFGPSLDIDIRSMM
jgi:hypothetical protein